MILFPAIDLKGGECVRLVHGEMGSATVIRRVILGTAAVKDPGFVREAARLFPGQVAVGIDARDGLVAVEGWARTVNMTAVDLGRRFEDAGVAAVVMTDIGRDGAMKGLNLAGTVALAEAVHLPVIASGGLASLEDVSRLLEPDCAVLAGAVTGRALYDGRLDPAAALAMIRAARAGAA